MRFNTPVPALVCCLVVSILADSLLFTGPAEAQFRTFTSVFIPAGVATDASGNVFVSHDNGTATFVTKFSASGTPLRSVQIGGFLDVGAIGAIAQVPSTGVLLHLLTNGVLIALNPADLSGNALLDLRALPVSTNAIYDVFSGTVSSFGGVIQPRFATFGDLAVYETSTYTDLFVTGMSQAQAFPFVMRVRIRNGAVESARVLLSSNAETVTAGRQKPRVPRGIAVNRAGRVLTTLPFAFVSPASPQPFDVMVAFSASFDPSDGVQASERPVLPLGNRVDLYSRGMTTDAAGNFFVGTAEVGTAALGRPGEGVLVVLPPTADRVRGAVGLNQPLTAFLDVTVSPDGRRIYGGVNLPSVGPASDVVVVAEVAELVATDVASEVPPDPDAPLEAPRPNPFAGRALLRFAAPATGQTRVALYDLLGRERVLLFDGLLHAREAHEVAIVGDDLPAGVYVVRMKGPGYQASRIAVCVR